MFGFSTVSLLVMALVYAVSTFLLPFYLQEILYLSPSFIGVLFVIAPVVTVVLAPLSGYLADRFGPRLPATAGALIFALSALLGAFLAIESHWLVPALMLALWGLSNGLFNPANGFAMINSVPKAHMGIASGSITLMFNLGAVLGVSLGGLLWTTIFRWHTGDPYAVPTTADPGAFVAGINITFLAAAGVTAVAVILSSLRGAQLEPASPSAERTH